jgi:hypothetical protein
VSDRSLWWIRKDINHTFPSWQFLAPNMRYNRLGMPSARDTLLNSEAMVNRS